MKAKKILTSGLIASAMTLAISGAMQNDTQAANPDKEKCYGVVKAGMNDCGSASKSHSCMGHATMDGAGDEWIALPKGLCMKLVGGSLAPIMENEDAATETKQSCDGKNGCAGMEK